MGYGHRLLLIVVALVALVFAGQMPRASAQDIKLSVLIEHALAADPNLNVKITSFHVPPGWQGDTHVHETDTLVYILSGRLVSDVVGRGKREYGAGDAYYETLGRKTVAWNASQNEGLSGLIINIDRAGASGHHSGADDHGSDDGHHD